MTPGGWIRVVLWWAAIVVLAILNGALRQKLLIPSLGSFAAQILSGLILSGLVFVIACVAMPGVGRHSAAQYWTIGIVWLALTLVFEFSFGLFVEHRPMAEVLQAYTFRGGNIWPVVLVSTLVSPWLAARLRGLL